MNAVVFSPEGHTYTIDARPVPSVTQILRKLYDFSHVSAAVLAAKGALGTAVHLACELHDADDLDEASVAPDVVPFLDAYRLFKQQKCTRVIATEQIVSHATVGYAGKFDLLTEFDDARWLIDWKIPLAISPVVALQTAAYVGAMSAELRGGKLPRRAALQLKADGKYKLHEFADPNDWPTFVAFATSHHWTTRNLK